MRLHNFRQVGKARKETLLQKNAVSGPVFCAAVMTESGRKQPVRQAGNTAFKIMQQQERSGHRADDRLHSTFKWKDTARKGEIVSERALVDDLEQHVAHLFLAQHLMADAAQPRF